MSSLKPALIGTVLPAIAAFAAGWWFRANHLRDDRGPPPANKVPISVTEEKELPAAGLDPVVMERLLTADPAARPKLFLQFLPVASAADAASIAEWLPKDDEVSWELLLLRWNEAAPHEMAAYMKAHGKKLWCRGIGLTLMAQSAPDSLVIPHPDTLSKDEAEEYEAHLQALLSVHPARALEQWRLAGGKVRLSPELEDFRRMGHRLFIEWAAENESVDPKSIQRWRDAAFADWLESDAAAAREFASGLNGKAATAAVTSVLKAMAEKDAAKALAWMKSLPPASIEENARTIVLQQFARRDLDGALAGIREAWPDEPSRRTMASRLLTALAEDGNPAALRVLQELPWNASDILDAKKVRGPGSTALQTLFRKWAEKDPEAAFAGLQSVPVRVRDPVFEYAVFEGWAVKSPQEALAAIPRLLAGDTKKQQEQRTSVLSDWVENDPERALRFIAGNKDPAARIEDERIAYDALGSTTIAEFWKYLPRLSVEAVGSGGAMYAANLARDQPATAARLFAQAPPEWQPVLQCSTLLARVGADGKQAPVAAAELTKFAAKLDPEWAGVCLRQVALQWSNSDAPAAGAWINGLPEVLRAPAIGGLLEGMGQSETPDPGDMFAWAAVMKPMDDDMENTRNNYLSSAFDDLVKKDPAAARKAAADPNLSDEWRKELLSRLEPGTPPP